MKTTNTDELAKLEEKVEVFAPKALLNNKLLKSKKPLYASIEEVMLALAATESDVAGDGRSNRKEFPVVAVTS